jgi:hypothetical protein
MSSNISSDEVYGERGCTNVERGVPIPSLACVPPRTSISKVDYDRVRSMELGSRRIDAKANSAAPTRRCWDRNLFILVIAISMWTTSKQYRTGL